LSDEMISAEKFLLSDAQWVIAREYTFSCWAELKQRILLDPLARVLEQSLRADDRESTLKLLRATPALLHVKVRSGHWGPPMSFAANLGHFELMKAVAELGAKDHQHAFERALLQGKVDCARWLHQHGANLQPGAVMGACETLNAAGVRLLAELGAPLTDASGNDRAPVAMVLETYSRNPPGKHAILELLAPPAPELADTVITAFHRGRVEELTQYLRREPGLLHRRFSYREIYPPAWGCRDDGRSGLHGTPIDGTTLLHLAIEFDEQAIFDRLLTLGADVNARATIDAAGFGGHTPLFQAVVGMPIACGRQHDGAMVQALLSRGALPDLQASLRKFLDWRERPEWHDPSHVTAAEWARGFPEKNWVSEKGLALLALADR
jgi:ankyrin repeat protein